MATGLPEKPRSEESERKGAESPDKKKQQDVAKDHSFIRAGEL